jgi:hypothetical protein
VTENNLPEMFYKVKAAYERILYIQNMNAQRIGEITRLEGRLIRDQRVFAARVAAAKVNVRKCKGLDAVELSPSCCSGESKHCPA